MFEKRIWFKKKRYQIFPLYTMYFLSRITHHVFITLDVHDVVVYILKWLIGILFNLALQEIKPKAVVFISIHSRENNAAIATFYGCFLWIYEQEYISSKIYDFKLSNTLSSPPVIIFGSSYFLKFRFTNVWIIMKSV